jgi:hypothetical protein
LKSYHFIDDIMHDLKIDQTTVIVPYKLYKGKYVSFLLGPQRRYGRTEESSNNRCNCYRSKRKAQLASNEFINHS